MYDTKNMSFTLRRSQKIPEVFTIEPTIHGDERGFFAETYKMSEFAELGFDVTFVQDNHSKSSRGVLRGLHFQRPPKAVGKLVQVMAGEIYDVAVDVRKGSLTYGQWVAEILNDQNKKQMFSPKGFAHGILVLSETAHVFYKMTGEYSPEHDTGILWNDPDLGIPWPIADPILSKKDATAPRLRDATTGFTYALSSQGASK